MSSRESRKPPVNYPFHVARAISNLKKLLHFINLVILVVDARAPYSTLYKGYKDLFWGRDIVLVINKTDLAIDEITREWMKGWRENWLAVCPVSCRTRRGIDKLRDILLDRLSSRPVLNVLVAGAPNVGKSSLINALIGRRKAKRADKPGVTRGLQWLKLSSNLKLLDSPGLTPPMPEDWDTYYKLVAVNVAPLSEDIPAIRVLYGLRRIFKERVLESEGIFEPELSSKLRAILLGPNLEHEILRYFAKGSTAELQQAALYTLQSLAKGKLGRISWERFSEFKG